jgi:hypothetical protein
MSLITETGERESSSSPLIKIGFYTIEQADFCIVLSPQMIGSDYISLYLAGLYVI